MLRPFWNYYGGKYRAAPRYPAPQYEAIVEPFAGAAGYSLRYPMRKVILVEIYPVVAEIWRFLIKARPDEILRIPLVDAVDDLPSWVPEGARLLIGFVMGDACVQPGRVLNAGRRKLRETGRKYQGWTIARRQRTAAQVPFIRHWQIIEGDYSSAPDTDATWFIDPPYNNAAGRIYKHSELDYEALGRWCRSRKGQVIVCEGGGSSWLPFTPKGRSRHSINNPKGAEEAEFLAGFQGPEQIILE